MNAWQLLTALQAYLTEALKDLPLPLNGRDGQGRPLPLNSEDADSSELLRPAAVYRGSMPHTTQDAFSAAPFVVLQILGGHDDADGLHQMRVVLRLCIVSHDLEGAEEDLHKLISLVRLRLLAMPDRVLTKKFRLVPEESGGLAPWERPDEQVSPFLQAHIFTTWQTKGVAHVAV